MKNKRAIVFFAWGAKHIELVADCLRESRLPDHPLFLMTDTTTEVRGLPATVVVLKRDCYLLGKARKTELFPHLPEQIDTALVLDADTRVIDDISLGFEKAERYGMAIVPAPHYSLADFRDFRQVMLNEGVTPRGQIIYNSGIVFCARRRPDVCAVFDLALKLAQKYSDKPWSDQTYLSLAMELLNFNPHTLSPSFNYRAFGELISGSIRIWHSYEPLPRNAASLEKGYLHRYEKGKLVKAVKVPL
ncbi:MAG TPA: hypothetical protein VKE30_09375 [Chthoniobacterales bacterium]|nr:hypothetical protein [Chthoniobacterales bacterium]